MSATGMRATGVMAWRFLWARPLGAVLNVLLLSLGLGSMAFLLLVGAQLSRAFDRDLAGIDVVVGAKGSPMQLIMSGVLHLDVPPGNVPLAAVRKLEKNPFVQRLIPLSLGDSYQSYRIVGTTPDYIDLYQAKLAEVNNKAVGKLWDAPMQVVLGASVARTLGMQLGQRLVGSHGLGSGGHLHGDNPYTVVGILQPSGSVLDRLILTDIASVWSVHEDAIALDDGDRAALEEDREITMAIIQYTSPMAAVSFPRFVNTTTDMQAAAPALEITRLLTLLGLGTDVLRAFAAVLLLTAGLSVFIALWSAVRERRADLALLRMLGASPAKVASLLLTEALWMAILATLCGLALGQALTAALAVFLQLDHSLLIGGVMWPPSLGLVPGLALGVSLLSAGVPTVAAYRVSVLSLLQDPS